MNSPLHNAFLQQRMLGAQCTDSNTSGSTPLANASHLQTLATTDCTLANAQPQQTELWLTCSGLLCVQWWITMTAAGWLLLLVCAAMALCALAFQFLLCDDQKVKQVCLLLNSFFLNLDSFKMCFQICFRTIGFIDLHPLPACQCQLMTLCYISEY